MGRQLWNFSFMWNLYKIKVFIDVYVIKRVCVWQKFGKRIWKQSEIYIDQYKINESNTLYENDVVLLRIK